jgi:hypothetical protein
MRYDNDTVRASETADFINRTYKHDPSGGTVMRIDESLNNLAQKFIEASSFCECVLDAVDKFEKDDDPYEEEADDDEE